MKTYYQIYDLISQMQECSFNAAESILHVAVLCGYMDKNGIDPENLTELEQHRQYYRGYTFRFMELSAKLSRSDVDRLTGKLPFTYEVNRIRINGEELRT